MKTRLLPLSLVVLLLLSLSARADDTTLTETDTLLIADETETLTGSSPEWTVSREFVGGRTGYIHPFISVGGRYTDNLFNAPTDPQSDFITIISPGLWLVAPPSRQQLLRVSTMVATPGGLEIARFRTETARRFQGYALYRADIESYVDFSEEDRTNHHGEVFFQYQAPAGFSLELLDMYQEEQDPFYGDTDQTRDLELFKSNLFHVLAVVPLFAKSDVRAEYANYRIDFDSEENAYRQREDNTYSARLTRQILARTEFFLLYEHIDIDYDKKILPDSTEDHAFAGIEWQATAKSRGRVMIGYGQKYFLYEGVEDYGEPIGEARVDYRFTSKSSAYLQASRKMNEPDAPSSSGTMATLVRLGLQQKPTPRLEVTADVSYLFEAYREEAIVDDEVGVREDSYYSAGLALVYTPLRWLNVTVGYRYRQRDSNFTALCYRNNTAYLRVSAAL